MRFSSFDEAGCTRPEPALLGLRQDFFERFMLLPELPVAFDNHIQQRIYDELKLFNGCRVRRAAARKVSSPDSSH
jgi:hypothetical protein